MTPLRRPLASAFALAALVAAAAPLATSCLEVARSRAEDDLAVGRAESAAVAVRVDDGLACVRELGPGVVWLRAQAPIFGGELEVRDAAAELELRLTNVLADATVEATSDAGAPLAVREARGPGRKEKRFVVTLPPAGGGARRLRFRVRTPDEADPRPYRFVVLADVQEAIDTVHEVYARIDAVPDARFVIFSGDLTRQGGEDELTAFEREEEHLGVPLYATVGNHELGADRVVFQERYGRASTSFDFRGVRFTLLDSASATIDPLVLDRLEGWLDGALARPHVVAMHIPPLDPVGVRNGAFASRMEAAALLERLARGQVDATFYGHVHTYYAFANAGIPAYVTGGGGAIPERMDGIGRNFLTVTVDPARGVDEVALVRVDPD